MITRKIEVYVSDEDKQQQKEMRHTVYEWRDNVRRAANAIVAHKFVQQNVRDFIYFTEEVKEKFSVKDVLEQGPGLSEQNITYRVVSKMLKGKVPSDIITCLNQSVAKTFKETLSDYLKGKASVRNYKNNIPIPFSAKSLSNIHKNETDGKYYFTLFGIPFACRLGADRSNNAVIIDRCISGEYKLCSSSLQIIDERKKMFLLLCVDQPQKEVTLEKDNMLCAFLSVDTPITYSVITKKKTQKGEPKQYEIGNKDEFLYRRTQIQAAVRRCQINNRYAKGGHGRKKKCQAIERWHEKEKKYIDTKLHLYSRMLVDAAVKYKCATIHLVNQKPREDEAKEKNQHGEPFLLRNWSYYGLKQKIAYKAKMYGIKLMQDKEIETDE